MFLSLSPLSSLAALPSLPTYLQETNTNSPSLLPPQQQQELIDVSTKSLQVGGEGGWGTE